MLFKTNLKQEKGFTLLEIALVMVISGLILYAMVESYLRWDALLRSNKTQEHIGIVADALSAYASRNYRVPCPADPANVGGGVAEPVGTEKGSGLAGTAIANCITVPTNPRQGIIPYKTLGISADYIRDGWGNYFTYKVNPTFTTDPNDNTTLVHAKCRTTDWFEGSILVGVSPNQWLDGGRNIAPQKARFCCAQSANGDLINVYSAAGVAPANRAIIFNPDPADWYAPATSLADPYDTHTSESDVTFNNPTDPVDPITFDLNPIQQPDPASLAEVGIPNNYPRSYYSNVIYGGGIGGMSGSTVFGHTDMAVYALVSHGKNGLGAFLSNGTIGPTDGAGASELTNINTKDVWDLPHDSTNDNTFYDDVVFWQTQTDMLARLRRDSCVVP